MSGAFKTRLGPRLLTALYLEFALTGTVSTLLGPLIPTLGRRCSFSDANAGSLVAAQFMGNVVGAFFATRNLRAAILTGMPLIALGVAGLVGVPCTLKYLSAGCYGVGLGLTISAINLVVANINTNRRASSLTLLNFVWGAGAVTSPLLVAWAVRQQILFRCLLGLAMLGLVLWLTIIHSEFPPEPARDNHNHASGYSSRLVFFAVLFFLYIGVETSLGSWTAIYAERMQPSTELLAYWSVGCFWAVLLIGRLNASLLLRYIPESRVYAGCVGFMVGGILLLLTARSGMQVLIGASTTAVGLAPMFPLILSFASNSLLACRNSGWVFSSAALGGAAVPWFTGRLSTWSGSLRVGFMAPALAALLISIMSITGILQATHIPGLRWRSNLADGSGDAGSNGSS